MATVYKVTVEQKTSAGEAFRNIIFSPFSTVANPLELGQQAAQAIEYALINGAEGIRITIELAHN